MVFVQRDGVESRKLTHSNDMCVACGICTDCCPTDSLRLNDVLAIRRGQADGDYLRIDDETCVLCGLCASSCAFGALTFEIDGKDTKELANYPTWTHDSNIDEDFYEELEEILIMGDLGVKATMEIMENLKKEVIFLKRL